MHLQFKLNKPIQEVFNCLSTADSFVKVHPLIFDMKPLPNGGYLVHEKLKIGFIKLNFTYPCTIESNPLSNTIKMKAVVKKIVHIQIVFKLSTQNGITVIDENTTFNSMLPVAPIMKSIFKKQHQLLFINIENNKFETNDFF